MKSEIKQRIEQTRNGKVPEGYKKTKHGVFPSHWKINKLGNYLQEYRELTNDIEKYPIYSSSRKGLLPQSQYYDKREAVTTNLGYKKVPNGYVTYRHMSDDDIFHFNMNTTEDTILVSSEYPVFNCNNNGNIDYILPLLNDSPRFKYYCRIQKMGGTRTRLYYKNLCQYTTAFPPLKEQQKIAKILSTQDTVIECYEKKIEQLKRMKKYYLQNMFPKHGETVPKIRFKGFTDPWEWRKLEKWGTFYYGHSCPKWSITNNATIPCIRYGELYSKFRTKIDKVYSYTNMPPEKLRFSKGTEVLIPRVGEDPKDYNHCAWLSLANVAIGEMISVFNTDQNPLFAATMFNATMQEEFAVRVEGGNVTNLYFEKLKNIETAFPSKGEQNTIASFFEIIDNLITLHQRKNEEEKKKKKALQQLLLTGIVRVKL